MHRMGEIHYQQGDYEAARQAYAEALGPVKSFQREGGLKYVRMNPCSALFHPGDAVAAKELHREALTLYPRAQNEEGIVWSLERMGIVVARHGDARKAARLLGAASAAREGLRMPLAP